MEDKNVRTIKNILVILLVIAFLGVCKLTGRVSLNLVFAVFVFFLVLPLVSFLENSHIPSALATIIGILIIVFFVWIIVWFTANIATVLVAELPAYVQRFEELDAMLVNLLRRRIDIPEGMSLLSILDVDWLGVLMPVVKSLSGRAIDIVRDSAVIILLVVFLLIERHTIVPKIVSISKSEKQEVTIGLLDKINEQVSKYLALKFFLSLITGLFFYLISVFAKLNFAVLWGALAFVMNFIPTFGSIIVTALTILMAVLQFMPMWNTVIIVAVATISTEMILGNIIDPRIQGARLDLSPFVILVALSLFGYIWGVMGMVIAVPVLSIIQIVLFNMEETKGIAIMLSSGGSMKRTFGSANRRDTGNQPSLFNQDYKNQPKN